MIIFKLPFNEQIYTVQENSNGRFPVIFFGFDENEKIPFEGEIILWNETLKLTTNDLIENTIKETEIQKDEYLKTIDNIVNFIRENQLQKLVFSRKKLVKNFNTIDLIKSFNQLCWSYSNAFVYLFKKDNECWIGAFSELLGKYNHDTQDFETMSLAGTLPISEEWTKKEIEEQQPVTQYIEEILNEYHSVEKSETYSHISGDIKHLRTDFKVKIQPENLEKTIAQLHPTPAVCGIPKDFCKNAISKFENYNRKLYAGYTKIKWQNTTYFFVNLRCGQFFKNTAKIFIGGGITADSNAEKEWQETELKSLAILNHLSIS